MKRAFIIAVAVLPMTFTASVVRADLVCSSTVLNACSGGGGATSITSGTTPVSGGADTQVCYNDAGTLRCGDSGLLFAETPNTLTVLGNIELGHATENTLSGSGGILSVESVAQVNTTAAQDGITGLKTFGGAAEGADTVRLNEDTGCVTFEGSSADTSETRLCVTNPSGGAGTVNLPNPAGSSGTLAWISFGQTFAGAQIFSVSIAGNGTVETVTTTKTTSFNEGMETYTNTGDTDGATITLLDNPTVGAHWNFAVTVAQTLTIVPSSGESLYMGTDQCNTSMTANAVGATTTIRAVVGGSGGVFMAFGSSGWTCND
jgi:hypothetical protein